MATRIATNASEVFSTLRVSLLLMDSDAISATSVRQDGDSENGSSVAARR